MQIPLAMTTYERVDYFEQTIESMIQSNMDINCLTIYDDKSSSDEKFLSLAQVAAKGAHVIYGDENKGPYLAAIKAISEAWSAYPDSEYCLYLQDDVEFSKGCLFEALNVAAEIKADGHRLGILSLFHRRDKLPEKNYRIMEIGHPGAVCWLLQKDFWNDFLMRGVDNPCKFAPNDERTRHFVRDLVDYKICKWAQVNDYTVAYTRHALVQHIGDKSTLSKTDMSYCRAKHYIKGCHHAKN